MVSTYPHCLAASGQLTFGHLVMRRKKEREKSRKGKTREDKESLYRGKDGEKWRGGTAGERNNSLRSITIEGEKRKEKGKK